MILSIYKITNKVNKKVYIGQTKEKVETRFQKHFYGKSCIALIAALNKYGKESFIIETLATTTDYQTANYLEAYFIIQYNSLANDNGYNIMEGGASRGITKQTRQRMSASAKRSLQSNPILRDKRISYLQKAKRRSGHAAVNRRAILCYETGIIYSSVTQAAEALDLDPSSISKVARGVLMRTGGFTFSYAWEK